MRLLNTGTFEFEEFYDDAIPPYAILSHRWRDDEVSYHDFLAHSKRGGAGFFKIVKACELAVSDSAENGGDYGSWIWIDTCAINKESSAELSEAINSMWKWYQNAAVCYAYLDDVPDRPFQESEWFTRGWTLQELLAPRKVEFYSKTWTRIGSKADLCNEIGAVTEIDWDIILGTDPFAIIFTSAAKKISWAASRRTSRAEDMAYCLLGLLDVNMPLLYGEGAKAFLRLQQELVRSRDDESVFAWSFFDETNSAFTLPSVEPFPGVLYPSRLFADTPARFAPCGNVVNDIFFADRGP
jgi:hypothetical protein